MKSLLLIFLLAAVCKAQVITVTSTVMVPTTLTDTSTQFVPGYCISLLDTPCRENQQHNGRYITFQDNDAYLFDPSVVEKLEVTIEPSEEQRSFNRNEDEDTLITQSLLKEKNNLIDSFKNYLVSDHPNFSGRPIQLLPIFSIFRPFMEIWSSLIRATRTVLKTVTKTFTTSTFVKVTTTTSTLFIHTSGCDEIKIDSNIPITVDNFPNCPPETSSSTTPFSSSKTPTTLTNTPMNPDTSTESTISTSSSTASSTSCLPTDPITTDITTDATTMTNADSTITDATTLDENLASTESTMDTTTLDFEAELDHLKWAQFLAEHSHQFESQEEHDKRKSLFLETDAKIMEHMNSREFSYTVGHSPFSIMTEEEKYEHLGRTTPKNAWFFWPKPGKSLSFERSIHGVDERSLPRSLDLRLTTCGKKMPIKNQGYCGSCWAFSAIAPMEWAKCIKSGGNYTLLSEQQLVSCVTNAYGCSGGDPSWAFSWLMASTNKGAVASAASYPYFSGSGGNSGTCSSKKVSIGATLKTWFMPFTCSANNTGGNANVTKAIMNAIKTYGVVSNCLFVVDSFFLYRSGVYSDPACSVFKGCGPTSNTNHCTSIVGWGYDEVSKKDYWILRNQWGTSWGNGGYMHIQKGINMCGIESQVYYTTVA